MRSHDRATAAVLWFSNLAHRSKATHFSSLHWWLPSFIPLNSLPTPTLSRGNELQICCMFVRKSNKIKVWFVLLISGIFNERKSSPSRRGRNSYICGFMQVINGLNHFLREGDSQPQMLSVVFCLFLQMWSDSSFTSHKHKHRDRFSLCGCWWSFTSSRCFSSAFMLVSVIGHVECWRFVLGERPQWTAACVVSNHFSTKHFLPHFFTAYEIHSTRRHLWTSQKDRSHGRRRDYQENGAEK